jgi:LL-diaminopimelate aminotransferase
MKGRQMKTGRYSRLVSGGGNLFQLIKQWKQQAIDSGIEVTNLGIGQPGGPAPLVARMACAEAVMSEEERMHEYQDNGCVACPEFMVNFFRFNCPQFIEGDLEDIAFLPLAGIKPALIAVVKSMGEIDDNIIVTGTRPGYPTPATVSEFLGYQGMDEDDFQDLFQVNIANYGFQVTPEYLESLPCNPSLLMVNYPNNPTGQIMTHEDWYDLCKYCSENGIRLFNDGAYNALDDSGENTPLSVVASSFGNLSWAEAMSASKLGNMTGWRVGLIAGSPDFVGDISKIKGDLDSGGFPGAYVGVNALVTKDPQYVYNIRDEYGRRRKALSGLLMSCGMRLSVEPKAGFFAMFDCPDAAFGQRIDADAENFNQLMIQNTGVVGVHFGNRYRCSVATAPMDDEMIERIGEAFSKAKVEYDD